MRYFIVILLISLLSAQDIERELDEFSKVKINVAARTKIIIGNEYSIRVEGRERDLKDLEIDVYRNTLEVDREKKNFFTFWHDDDDKLLITITTKSLEGLKLNASGKLEVEDVESKDFDLSINGSTDVIFNGKVEYMEVSIKGSGDLKLKDVSGKEMEVNISGSGDIDASGDYSILNVDIKGSGDINAFDLEVNELSASIYGSGNIKVTVEDIIEASIYGSGDVYYKGNPNKVRDKIYGSGSVERY